jgi:hypothetical protein
MKGSVIMNIIKAKDHPSNKDRTARLDPISGTIYQGQDVYRVRGGFIAMIGADHCIFDLFPTAFDARQAQIAYDRESIA